MGSNCHQGTGSLGQALIPALLQADFDVTCILRPSSKSEVPAGVSVKVADYTDIKSLVIALQNHDAVVEAFNPAASVHQASIIEAVAAAGVRHIITPDFSGNTFHPRASEALIFNPKLEAQRALERAVADAGERLFWTAIITGPWMDWAIEQGIFWVDRSKKVVTRYGSGDQKCSLSRHALNGEALVAVLTNPDKYRNRPAYFASFTVSTNEIIDAIRSLELDGWEVVDVPFDEFAEKARQMWHEDTKNGVRDRLHSAAYAALSTVALLDERNRFGSDFGNHVETGCDEGNGALRETLRRLLA
ncbi:hypothetical protein C8035_v001463 [Colletotrichum spinosum]|uniref:NAD(P)-binding domain-containing protein n=1 Tax=Colletotrichum spinosum TaxID=1347390 RepID=A0A4R8PZQ6_9PEZI|nr:hypothetical protein C8035_v001463 [Colletotrichum spinosum]